ncbi:MAG TPA: KEOPS complex subunit Pcc1 [Nitrososphaera sp.]
MTLNLQRQLDFSVSVDIHFPSSAEARAAVKALIPDNVNFPKGLSMKMFSKGASLSVELTSKNAPVSSVLNTLDEVLEHISVSRKVMMTGNA